MPRVLIVCPYATTGGGAEQWLLGILADGSLRHQGWMIDAIVMAQGPLVETLRQLSVTAIALPVGTSLAAIARRAGTLRRAILARGPDVVVANGVKAQLAVSLALVGTGLPTVWVKHDHSHDRILARVLGQRASLVVPTALEVGLPTSRSDLVIIEPPRPPHPVPREQALRRLAAHGWRPTAPLTLAMITRLVPYKGVDLAIEALADSRCKGWELLVIGDDDPATPGEAARLREVAAAKGVADRVFLAGAIPEAGRLLTAADAVGVLTRPGQPGAPTQEGYGIVASEAMLAGVPVIVAQPGPIGRRLTEGAEPAGIVLEAPDARHVADALVALTDDGSRARMGHQGHATALELPDQAEVTTRFISAITLAAGL